LPNQRQAVRDKAQGIFVVPLKITFEELKNTLQAQPVSLKTLPPELVNSWKTKDGLMRVEALPKGDPNDNEVLRRFCRRGAGGRAECDRRAGLDFSNPATPWCGRSSMPASGR